jgi:hypothetical protein
LEAETQGERKLNFTLKKKKIKIHKKYIETLDKLRTKEYYRINNEISFWQNR